MRRASVKLDRGALAALAERICRDAAASDARERYHPEEGVGAGDGRTRGSVQPDRQEGKV